MKPILLRGTCAHDLPTRSYLATGGRRWLLPAAVLVVSLACEGDPGPMGPQGPPGDSPRGASYVTHFDRAEDLDTWQYGLTGTWQVLGGQLVVAADRGDRAVIGPSSTFSGDLDLSVDATWIRRPGDAAIGLRFQASAEGAYVFAISSTGAYALSLEQAETGESSQLIDWTSAPNLYRDAPNGLRVVVRGATIRLYINGALVNQTLSTALTRGFVQLYVDGVGGSAEAAFDNLWVSTALPLL